jgi:hypothetical protein
MQPSDPGPADGHDGSAPHLAFHSRVSELRAALWREHGEPDRERRLARLVDRLAVAATRAGHVPEAAVAALREEWNRDAALALPLHSSLSLNAHRHRAIDTLLTASFARRHGGLQCPAS